MSEKRAESDLAVGTDMLEGLLVKGYSQKNTDEAWKRREKVRSESEPLRESTETSEQGQREYDYMRHTADTELQELFQVRFAPNTSVELLTIIYIESLH